MKKVHEELYELLVEKRIGLNKSVSTFSAVEFEKSMSSISHHVHEDVSIECFPTAVNNIDTVLEVAPRRRRKKAVRRALGRLFKVCTCCFRGQQNA